jgi:hypothetical protein
MNKNFVDRFKIRFTAGDGSLLDSKFLKILFDQEKALEESRNEFVEGVASNLTT